MTTDDKSSVEKDNGTTFWGKMLYLVELFVSISAAIIPLVTAGIVLLDKDGKIVSMMYGASENEQVSRLYVKAAIVLIALVATAIFTQRFLHLEKIKIGVSALEDQLRRQGRPSHSVSENFYENLDMGPWVQGAQSDIVLIGINLTSFLGTYRERINAQLAMGRRLKVVIIAPDDINLDTATRRSEISLGRPSYYKSKLETSILELKQMAAMAAKSGNEKNIELFLLPYVPTFSVKAFDLGSANAALIVEIYPHRTADAPPMFLLKPKSDPHWFAYFKRQLEVMIRDGVSLPLQE